MSKMEKWSCARANEWYAAMPWMRGCNYMPADCANRIAMWQALDAEKHFETIEREFVVMQKIGYNSIRIHLELPVWREERDSFLVRFERFIALAAKYGQLVMVCFGNDCTVPKNEHYRAPHLGEQVFDWGYHGGRKYSQHGTFPDAVGHSLLDEPETAEIFFDMVREIITKYRNDPRICVWDLFNEPGNNNRGTISVPHVKRIFEVARACDPIQPLTTCIWHVPSDITPAEQTALELSDVISYHNYADYDCNIRVLHELKKHNRPLLNTEWLHRIQHNTVQECFPLFFLEKVSCWNWGFVAGLYQTYEPWEGIWKSWEKGEADDLDFTKWQHDLIRPNLRPYDPKEIAIIRSYADLADQDFAARR
ncbi:MAG: cellulase family glycosylhydrolase [Lentisphaeria bacterium]|nr:cellulase family glycosylhydrolase [Lentisphaeria bacterium]